MTFDEAIKVIEIFASKKGMIEIYKVKELSKMVDKTTLPGTDTPKRGTNTVGTYIGDPIEEKPTSAVKAFETMEYTNPTRFAVGNGPTDCYGNPVAYC